MVVDEQPFLWSPRNVQAGGREVRPSEGVTTGHAKRHSTTVCGIPPVLNGERKELQVGSVR